MVKRCVALAILVSIVVDLVARLNIELPTLWRA
jgi:hypothetical protein